jgi:hypothetical protein
MSFLLQQAVVWGSDPISGFPFLQNSKKTSNVLDDFAGIFARECLWTASLPKLERLVDELLLCFSHPHAAKSERSGSSTKSHTL